MAALATTLTTPSSKLGRMLLFTCALEEKVLIDDDDGDDS
jgi:hypothetical protein